MTRIIILAEQLTEEMTRAANERVQTPGGMVVSKEEAEAVGRLLATSICFIGTSNFEKVVEMLNAKVDEVLNETPALAQFAEAEPR